MLVLRGGLYAGGFPGFMQKWPGYAGKMSFYDTIMIRAGNSAHNITRVVATV